MKTKYLFVCLSIRWDKDQRETRAATWPVRCLCELKISLINSCLNCCCVPQEGQCFYAQSFSHSSAHMSPPVTVLGYSKPHCLDFAAKQWKVEFLTFLVAKYNLESATLLWLLLMFKLLLLNYCQSMSWGQCESSHGIISAIFRTSKLPLRCVCTNVGVHQRDRKQAISDLSHYISVIFGCN